MKEQESGNLEKRIKLIEYRNGIYQGMIHPNEDRTNLGIYTWDSGEVYFGEWKHDMLDGEGILFFPFGGFIHGFFMKNKLNGAAFFKFSNGDIYEGFWRNGKLEGNCYKYFCDEERWILSDYKNGEFKKIISKGDGQPPSYVFNYITSTSDIAVKHQDDTFQQDGLKIEAINFNDGGQYLGLIKNSMPTSLGIFKYSDGKYDVGYYKDGSLDGLGRLNLHNGDVFDGFLQKGLFNGIGVFFQKQSCSWIYGNFENNKCVNILKKGQGAFPIEIIEKFRSENHRKAKKYIDKITPLDVYFAPMYNHIPIGPEKHNFYLDLSITNQANLSNNGGSQQKIPEQLPMKKVLPKDLTSSDYQSPPQKRSQSKGKTQQVPLKTPSVSSSLVSSANRQDNQNLKKDRQSSKSIGKSQTMQAQQQNPKIFVSQSSQGQDLKQSQQQQQDKKSNSKKEVPKKQNLVSPPPRQGRLGAQQQQSNQSSAKKSNLKKAKQNSSNSNKQRSRQSSVSKIQNEKQEIDQQSIHDYDNMVKLMSQHQEGQINISQSQGQNINFDEVFNTESSPKSQQIQQREFKQQKSLAQIIGSEEIDEPKQFPYQKSKSMAVFNSKKSSQASSVKQQNIHEIGNVSKISGIGQSDTSGVYKDNNRSGVANQGDFTGIIKPNIFGKKSSSAPKQAKQVQNKQKDDKSGTNNEQSDSDSSFSSYSSDRVVRKQTAPPTSGRKQIAIIKEEERMRSYSGTPANRFVESYTNRDYFGSRDDQVSSGGKSYKNEQDLRESLEEEENKQFLEAERLSKEEVESKIERAHDKKNNDQDEEYGHIKIKDIINVDDQSNQNSHVGEQSRKGADSTPHNQFITIQNQKNKPIQIQKNEQIISDKQGFNQIEKDNDTPISKKLEDLQHLAQNRDIQKMYQSKKSNSILELENIRNEIANYEQIAQQDLPQRSKKSKQGKKDTSRETSHPRTPQSIVTPKHLPSQSPNFQQSPILTSLPNPKIQYQQEEELDLEESEHVLDSIKQIKQQMIHQLNHLENKQREVTTPAASNFKYNIAPNFNIPNDENHILKDDSLNQDISPQNPIENFESPFKKDSLVYERENSQGRGRSTNHSRVENSRSYKYYTEEEANQIAQKIEQNLAFQGDQTNKQTKVSENERGENFINEESVQVGDINEEIQIDDQRAGREDRVVRSKLERDSEMHDIQEKQIQDSILQAEKLNQMLDGNTNQQRLNQIQSYQRQQNEQMRLSAQGQQEFLASQKIDEQNQNQKTQAAQINQQNQQGQSQQNIKNHSVAASPNSQSPINQIQQRSISPQSNSLNSSQITAGQVIQVVKEILPPTQQTTIYQKKLSDNAIQSTVVTKTIQPIVTTKIISPVRSRPSSQSNSPLTKQNQNALQNNSPGKFNSQIISQQLLPQQVLGQLQSIIGGGNSNQQGQQPANQNKIYSDRTQNRIVQAVNQQWKQKNPELFQNITPMEFYQSIVQRQNILKDLSPEQLEQLEQDIKTLKQMNVADDLQIILEQNISNVTSPLNASNNTDIKHYTFQGDDITPSLQRRKQEEELAATAAKTALDVTAAAEKARKEYEIQQQHLQNQLALTQNHTLLTQQQQKEIQELKKQQEEFIKQQLEIQKQQAEYLEKLQKQQALIIQQGEEQRKRHEEEKTRQLKEIEALEKQKNQRIIEEEERLKQLRDMQEMVRQQIEDDLQRKKLEDEEHRKRQKALFDKEQEILDRLQDEQVKLSQLQQEQARLQAQELENKKVRDMQLKMEEELRKKEEEKLEQLKIQSASLNEEIKNNQSRSEEERVKMHQLQLKYAEDQRKQQEILDELNSQKLLKENSQRQQDIIQQQDILEQQKQINEQQYALQQEQLRIQREREELEILQKQRNEESFINEQQRLAILQSKEQELEQQIRQQNQSFLAQQEELQRQKQQLESQKLDLILEQDRLKKKSDLDDAKLKDVEKNLQEQLSKIENEKDQQIQRDQEIQARVRQESINAQQEELQRQKQQIEFQKQDLIIEQERLRQKLKEEEEKRLEAERILQETILKKQLEDSATVQLKNQVDLEKLEQQKQIEIKLREQQEQIKREKEQLERERQQQEYEKQKQHEKEKEVIELQNALKQKQLFLEQQQRETQLKLEQQFKEQQEQMLREKTEIEKQKIIQEQQKQKQIELEQAAKQQEERLKQQKLLLELEQEQKKRDAEQQLRFQQEQIQKEKEEVQKQKELLAQMEREKIAMELARQQKEQEERRKIEEQEKRDNYFKKVDVFTKEIESRRGYISPRQSSLDIPPSTQVILNNPSTLENKDSSNLLFKTNQSASSSPINTNRSDIETMIRESQARLKQSIAQSVQQVDKIGQIVNPYQDISIKNSESAEAVKRSTHQPTTTQYPITNTNLQQESQPQKDILESYSQQKNIDLFNQIDKIVRSASQSASTSPIGTNNNKNNFGDSLDRLNRFTGSQVTQQTPSTEIKNQAQTDLDLQNRVNQIQNQSKSSESVISALPTPINSVQPIQTKTTQEQKNSSYIPTSDDFRGSLLLNNLEKSTQNQIRSDLFKSIEGVNSIVSPNSKNQNKSSFGDFSSQNQQQNKVQGVSDYTSYQYQSQVSSTPSNPIFQKIEPSALTNNNSANKQPLEKNNQYQLPSSVTFSALPSVTSYMPLTQSIQQNTVQGEGLLNRLDNKNDNKKQNANSQQNPVSEQIVDSILSEPFAPQPTANFDTRSSISSIKREPISYPGNTYTASVSGIPIQPYSSWTNPVSLNSSGGTAAFLGLPVSQQNKNSQPQTNQNSANQTLFVSFGNEKILGSNPLKSSVPGTNKDQILSGLPTYTPSILMSTSFSKLPNNSFNQGEKDKQSSVRSSGAVSNEYKQALYQKQNIIPASDQLTAGALKSNPTTYVSNQKPSINIGNINQGSYTTSSLTGVDAYIPLTTGASALISPRTQELNSYKITTSALVPSSRQVVIGNPSSIETSDQKYNKRLSITSDVIEEDPKRSNNQDSASKLGNNTLNSSAGFIGYKKKIKIQPSPQVIKETHLPVIRSNSNNNSKDSSFFLNNNSFSQNNPKIPNPTSVAAGNNNYILNNSFSNLNNSFSGAPKDTITAGTNFNNFLNSSFTDEKSKQQRNTLDKLNKQGQLNQVNGLIKSGESQQSQQKISQFNSPQSQKIASQLASTQNLNRFASPQSDTSRGSVSLTKKTNVTVVHTPGTEGAISLVRAIQNTYTYNEPTHNDDSFHNSSFNNLNKSLLDSQASQYLVYI
ncbi:MORN repeat protein, putative (macronuclear) [Tetrahymena thermophila SB210]|uniref:MORN repeat protein, putative n=1 Tax=Tetrahymena thermophila (strain SB210) TaxID=312017 RepID=Q22GJ1_TETTS|nr:MORN repeat protein, putative [Tetrahymena thermophila SB210]EAR84340.2 MORN repeat protein, putative [Tetrahymena thermophila SB210]|eukprot:XP_001032003.2 MORN repeat protein, putative [Tetrahymena thermophila SB210]